MTSIERTLEPQIAPLNPPAIEKNLRSPKKSLGTKIRNFCRNSIKFFTGGALCNPALNKKDVRLIKRFKHHQIYAFPQSAQRVHPQTHEHRFNDSLEGMRDFARDMVCLAMDSIQKIHIDPNLKIAVNSLGKLPDTLKKVAKEAIEMGSLSINPIFDLISQFKVNDKAMGQLDRILKWALQDLDPEFIASFEEELSKKVDLKKITLEQSKGCAQGIFNWLFNTDHHESPNHYLKNAYSEEIVSHVLQCALQMLAENKIDLYKNKANAILQDKLPEIVQATIRKNAEKITDLLTERLATILDKMGDQQFTVLFDKIVEIVGKHITHISDSYEVAEKAAKDHKELKKLATKIVRRSPKSPHEEQVYQKCKKYLERLKKRGGTASIQEDVLLKTFLARTGNEAPSIDSNIVEDLSKLILDTLLPTVVKEGVKTSGLEHLLSQIELPQEFIELTEEARKIAENILTPEQYAEASQIVKMGTDFKELALEGCSEVIKLGLNEAVEMLVKQMSKPEELNLVMANSLLPSSLDTMMKFFADDLIQERLKQLAPYFLHIPKEGYREALLEELFNCAKKEAEHYIFSDKDKERFFISVGARVDEITNLIQKVQDKHPNKSDLRSVIAIIKEYYKYEKVPQENNPYFANFIDAALKTGEFGSFLPRVFNLMFARNMATQLITSSLYHLRTSSRPLLNTIIPSTREKFLHAELMEKWVAPLPTIEALETEIASLEEDIEALQDRIQEEGQDQEILQTKLFTLLKKLEEKNELKPRVLEAQALHKRNLQDAKDQLPLQVDKVSRLAYHIIQLKTKRKIPVIGPLFFKSFVGPDAEKIKRVVLTLLNHTMGHQAFNEHLLSKIFSTVFLALDKTAKAPPGNYPLLNRDCQQSLDKIHIPVTMDSLKTPALNIAIDSPVQKPSVWKRILDFIGGIFRKIGRFFKSQNPFNLSKHHIRLMHALKNKYTIDSTDSSQEETPSESSNEGEKEVADFPELVTSMDDKRLKRTSVFFDEEIPDLHSAIKKVGDFVSEFMKTISDEIYDAKIKPAIKLLKKNAHKVPEYLEQILEWTSKIISPLANTIVKKIVQKGYKFDLDDPTRSFFDILFQDLKDEQGQMKMSVLDKLEDNLRKSKIAQRLNENELKNYIVPIRQWASQSYESKKEIKSLADFIAEHEKNLNNFHYSDVRVSKFYVNAIQWLIKYKIENHANGLQEFLETKLDVLIQTHLHNNMQHLSKLIFNRLASQIDLISPEEYKTLFDYCTKDVDNLAVNLLKAENAIKKSLTDEQKNDESYVNEQLNRELTSAKKDPKNEGRLAYALSDFANHLLNPPAFIKENPEDLKNYREEEEVKVFNQIARRLIDLILPTGTKNVKGHILMVDAFQELLDNILIDPEVTEIFENLYSLTKSLMPEKYANKLDSIGRKVKDVIKKFIINSLKQHATGVIGKKLQESFKMLSDPLQREELFVNHFTTINQQIVRSFTKMLLNNENASNKDIFKIMVESQYAPIAKGQLTDHIWNLCQEKFKFSWAHLNIEKADFKNQYIPLFIDDFVKDYLKPFLLSKDFQPVFQNLIQNPQDKEIISATLMMLMDKTQCWEPGQKKQVFPHFKKIVEPFLETIICELVDQQHFLQKEQPELEMNPQHIEDHLNSYFNGENDNNTQYADLIMHIMEMGRFGANRTDKKTLTEKIWGRTLTEALVDNFKDSDAVRDGLTKVLLPALHPVRGSLGGLMGLVVQGLKDKYTESYIKGLVNPPSLAGLEKRRNKIEKKIEDLQEKLEQPDLSEEQKAQFHLKLENLQNKSEETIEALENLEETSSPEYIQRKQENIKNQFQEGLEVIARLLYDLVDHVAYNKGGALALGAWHKVAGVNPNHLIEVEKEFYAKFFRNPDLILDLLVKVTDDVLDVVEEKNRLLALA